MPARIQRRRVKGWRAPEGAIYVGRGSKWGNPWKTLRLPGGQYAAVDDRSRMHYGELYNHFGIRNTRPEALARAVEVYRNWLHGWQVSGHSREDAEAYKAAARTELAGKDLMCWCPPNHPCHADILLSIANQGPDL